MPFGLRPILAMQLASADRHVPGVRRPLLTSEEPGTPVTWLPQLPCLKRGGFSADRRFTSMPRPGYKRLFLDLASQPADAGTPALLNGGAPSGPV